MKLNDAPKERRNLTARVLFALNRETVSNVARTYKNCKNTSEIVAVAWEPSDRSPRWSPTISHYVIDVENCVRRVFASREDSAELNAAWQRFLNGDGSIIDCASARMVKILGAAFRRSDLEPRTYFRTTRCYRNKPERNETCPQNV